MNTRNTSSRARRAAALLAALGALTVALPVSSRAAQTRAFAFTTDFSAGSIADAHFGPPRTVAIDQEPVSSDAVLRYFDGYLYVVNRAGFDNIQILDPGNGFATVHQWSVGNGSNPHDIEFVSPSKAFVSRYDTPDLWIINPQTGAHTGTISLAAFADADGLPEIDRLAYRSGRIYVTVQRLDRNNFYSPTDSSQVVVINPLTDAIVDQNPGAPGVQGILLPFQNPYTELIVDPSGDLLVGCAGFFGVADGGVARVHPAAGTATVEISEAALGGDMNDVAVLNGSRGFAVISDASFATLLKSYDRNSGASTGTPYSTPGFSIADVEVNDRGELWLCDRTPANPGLRVFDAATGAQLTGSPLGTGLPPQDVTFDLASPVGVPQGGELAAGALEILGVSPNPSADLSRVRFRVGGAADRNAEPVRIVIHDVTGRAVLARTLGPAEGERAFDWDGRDDGGARVARGVYFVHLRGPAGEVSRSIVRY